MFKVTKKEIIWGGRKLTLETGKIARQADGAVLATYGETVVLCTAVAAKTPKADVDFFPLTINYQEKTFAAGKIPGGFLKREGRPSEKETLTSRLIDRPIRPLFPEGFFNETQVICTVLSHDIQNDPDVVAMIGASAALTISGIPFMGPIAGARVGYINGEYLLNPTRAEMTEGDNKLDLVVAGTRRAVLMVESEAKELPEDVMLGAVMYGHKQMQPVIDMIISLAEHCAKDPWELKLPETDTVFVQKVAQLAEADLRDAYKLTVKQDRATRLAEVKEKTKTALVAENYEERKISSQFKKLEKDIVRSDAVHNKRRIDGRGPADIRQIQCEVGFLPMVHGAALFTRGETQAVVVTTLGTSEDEQIMDTLEGDWREHFMLHYNFPPYSVGEANFMRAPGRREIGHGKLAWRAVRAMLPKKEDFPYTIRIVSEITESNGSSSMASVCGASLSLMEAGVPIKRAVAGIAMGLIKEKDGFIVLSDIMGDEDHLGDMDFKVAGTSEGITALQMDIKIDGITEEIMKVALAQASQGRKHILGKMDKTLSQSRGSVNKNAPRITTITIPKDKIREVIGSGGKVIREITETTGAKIDIEDDGTIRVAAVNTEQGQKALDWIKSIVAEPEVGMIYTGKVCRIVDFGAFVTLMGKTDGLVHISELADHRVGKVTDVVQEGDTVKVKVLEIDGRGKIRLSLRAVDQETGAERPRAPKGNRENREEGFEEREKKPA